MTGVLDLLRVGVLAGIPVGIGIGALLTARRRAVRTMLKGVPGMSKLPAIWGMSLALAVVMGVVAAWVYYILWANWGLGAIPYLVIAVVLAAVLSALSFAPAYGGNRMEFAPELSALNFIVALGFGLLVPWLMG